MVVDAAGLEAFFAIDFLVFGHGLRQLKPIIPRTDIPTTCPYKIAPTISPTTPPARISQVALSRQRTNAANASSAMTRATPLVARASHRTRLERFASQMRHCDQNRANHPGVDAIEQAAHKAAAAHFRDERRSQNHQHERR